MKFKNFMLWLVGVLIIGSTLKLLVPKMFIGFWRYFFIIIILIIARGIFKIDYLRGVNENGN